MPTVLTYSLVAAKEHPLDAWEIAAPVAEVNHPKQDSVVLFYLADMRLHPARIHCDSARPIKLPKCHESCRLLRVRFEVGFGERNPLDCAASSEVEISMDFVKCHSFHLADICN